MHQRATYWHPGVNDGFGNLSFAAVVPVAIMCRWEDKAVLFRNSQGQEEVSDAVIYPDRPLLLRGFVALGDHVETGPVDPRRLAGAREIRFAGSSPSLTAGLVLHKVLV